MKGFCGRKLFPIGDPHHSWNPIAQPREISPIVFDVYYVFWRARSCEIYGMKYECCFPPLYPRLLKSHSLVPLYFLGEEVRDAAFSMHI